MRVCSIFSDVGKFCVAHDLGQLKRDARGDVRNLNFRVTSRICCLDKQKMTFVEGRYAT